MEGKVIRKQMIVTDRELVTKRDATGCNQTIGYKDTVTPVYDMEIDGKKLLNVVDVVRSKNGSMYLRRLNPDTRRINATEIPNIGSNAEMLRMVEKTISEYDPQLEAIKSAVGSSGE